MRIFEKRRFDFFIGGKFRSTSVLKQRGYETFITRNMGTEINPQSYPGCVQSVNPTFLPGLDGTLTGKSSP